MFSAVQEKTLYIFGACNFASIFVVWAFYPETANRTLEEMEFLFAADMPWVWDAEKTNAKLKAEFDEKQARSLAEEEKTGGAGNLLRYLSTRHSQRVANAKEI
jgi:hypothetical protein